MLFSFLPLQKPYQQLLFWLEASLACDTYQGIQNEPLFQDIKISHPPQKAILHSLYPSNESSYSS